MRLKAAKPVFALILIGLFSGVSLGDEVSSANDLSENCRSCAHKAYSPERAATYYQRAIAARTCTEQHKWASITLRFDRLHEPAMALVAKTDIEDCT